MITKEKPKKVKKALEKDIQREICEWLLRNGYFYWRNNNIPVFGRNNAGKMTFRAQSKHTPKGLPDIFVLNHGTLFGIEVKCTTGLRSEQRDIMGKINHCGGRYFVAHKLEDVQRVMAAWPRP